MLFRDQYVLLGNGTEISMHEHDFTRATARLNSLFFSQEYKSELISTFGVKCWSDITDGHRTVGVQLAFALYKLFVSELQKVIRTHEETEPINFPVQEMGHAERGNVRYIGIWTIKRTIQRSQRY